jgi:hypothetical protein
VRVEADPLLGADAGDEPGRVVDGADPPAVDQGGAVAEPFGLSHEVGDQQDRYALVADAADEVPGVASGLGVRPVVSSSRIAIRGRPIRASTIDSRCFCPPDSLR